MNTLVRDRDLVLGTYRLVAWAAAALALTVTIVKRSDNLRGFVVLPRRGSWNVVSVG